MQVDVKDRREPRPNPRRKIALEKEVKGRFCNRKIVATD